MFSTLGRLGAAMVAAALLTACGNKPATSSTGQILIVRGGSPVGGATPSAATAGTPVLASIAAGGAQVPGATTDGLAVDPAQDAQQEAIQATVREADPYRVKYVDLDSDAAG